MLDKLLLHSNLLDSFCLLVSVALATGIVGVMRVDHLFIRRRLEAESLSRRLWAHGLADASFDGLLIHRQGVALMMNRALVRMLGLREREFLGQNFCTVARGDEVAALRFELEQKRDRGGDQQPVDRIRGPAGDRDGGARCHQAPGRCRMDRPADAS
jgi:PAS domain-containing protein